MGIRLTQDHLHTTLAGKLQGIPDEIVKNLFQLGPIRIKEQSV